MKRIFTFVRRFCLPRYIYIYRLCIYVYCTESYQKRKFFKTIITHTVKPSCSVINALKRKCNMNFTCLVCVCVCTRCYHLLYTLYKLYLYRGFCVIHLVGLHTCVFYNWNKGNVSIRCVCGGLCKKQGQEKKGYSEYVRIRRSPPWL